MLFVFCCSLEFVIGVASTVLFDYSASRNENESPEMGSIVRLNCLLYASIYFDPFNLGEKVGVAILWFQPNDLS